MEVSMALAQPTPISSTTNGFAYPQPLEILSVPGPAGSFAVVGINFTGAVGNEEIKFFMDGNLFATVKFDSNGKSYVALGYNNLNNIVVPGGSKITMSRTNNYNTVVSFLVSGLFYKAS
jgi:hypothetical protein